MPLRRDQSRRGPVGPEIYKELERWRDDGLVEFKDTDGYDEVIARLLRTLRLHMLDPCHDDEITKALRNRRSTL